MFRAGILVCAWALVACHRHPERTPEGTLARLHDALATGHPPFAEVADTRIMGEARSLGNALRIQEHIAVPLTDQGFDMAMANSGVDMPADRYFAGVLRLLGSGHCERIGDERLPPELATVPSPGDQWPPRMLHVQASVARRAQNAYAADYRCDGGPSFGAVFVHPEPNDGTWRVAIIGASQQR